MAYFVNEVKMIGYVDSTPVVTPKNSSNRQHIATFNITTIDVFVNPRGEYCENKQTHCITVLNCDIVKDIIWDFNKNISKLSIGDKVEINGYFYNTPRDDMPISQRPQIVVVKKRGVVLIMKNKIGILMPKEVQSYFANEIRIAGIVYSTPTINPKKDCYNGLIANFVIYTIEIRRNLYDERFEYKQIHQVSVYSTDIIKALIWNQERAEQILRAGAKIELIGKLESIDHKKPNNVMERQTRISVTKEGGIKIIYYRNEDNKIYIPNQDQDFLEGNHQEDAFCYQDGNM